MSRAVILLSLYDLMMWTGKISLFVEGSSQIICGTVMEISRSTGEHYKKKPLSV